VKLNSAEAPVVSALTTFPSRLGDSPHRLIISRIAMPL